MSVTRAAAAPASASPAPLPDLCTPAVRAAAAAELKVTVPAARTTESVLSLPGIETLDALQCVLRPAGTTPVQAIVIRSRALDADVVFRTLDRFDTPGLEKLDGATATSPDGGAYWQNVGTTLWLRAGDRVLTVQIVTDHEAAPGLPGLARRVGVAVLQQGPQE